MGDDAAGAASRAVQVTERAACVLAPNPSPMTLDGTNTWILAEPGAAEGVVVDPGPQDETHLRAVAAAATARGVRVRHVVLTHHHDDHAQGAGDFADLVGADVRSLGDGTLTPCGLDDVWDVAGLRVAVWATPGHTADSTCLFLPDDASVLTGDTVLGRGTTVVAWPDGRLGDYLDTLEMLRRAVAEHDVRVFLPGHGAPLHDPAATVEFYLAHRRERLQQVSAALAAQGGAVRGAGVDDHLVESVVSAVYADVPRDVWPAARRSVRAQLDHLVNG